MMTRNCFKANIWVYISHSQTWVFLLIYCCLVLAEITGANKDKLEPGGLTHAYNPKIWSGILA